MSTFTQTDKTWFQIRPSETQRVLFCDYGFDLNDIVRITEPGMLFEGVYVFNILFYNNNYEWKQFDFKKKSDCITAHRELCRAWSKTGEFSNGQPTDGT